MANFIRAANAAGLEWLGEDFATEADEDDEGSEYVDDEGAGASESPLYVTMPTIAGLQKVLSLWRDFSTNGARPEQDGAAWWALFGYLRDIRPWSAKDRVDPTVKPFVERMLARYPDRPVRLELDLWFRENSDLRADARVYITALMESLGGHVIDFVTIEQIKYQAALIELPGAQARSLSDLAGPLADANKVMRVRPQSLYEAAPREPAAGSPSTVPPVMADPRPPIAAVLDGYPVQNHDLLANRLIVQEVDVTAAAVPVARRHHGTSMASLIIHGDLDIAEPPLDRTIVSVPILAAPQNLNHECTPPDKLPIGLIYRAVLALVANQDGTPRADGRIVILNHSVCDREAPFARRPSHWAKLLDYLSHKYRLLFVVSAGNTPDTFELDSYSDCDEFEQADPVERQIVLLRSIEHGKGTRLILSPAESMNALTVGAIHSDGSAGCPVGCTDPFEPIGVTNLASSVGLGVNRAIKPDMVEHGGRQMVRTDTEGGVVSAWAHEHPDVGQLTAAPDPSGGSTSKVSRSTGTSNAAALVTRAAIRLGANLESLFQSDQQDWSLSDTRAVVLKALLTHGCRWGDTGKLLDEIYPGHWQRKREAISRFLGYGRPDLDRVITGAGNRITLLADDMIEAGTLHEYRVPIPRAMINNREVRRITMTLAWSSPIDPLTQRYRGVLVELVDANGKRGFWNGVAPTLQPSAFAGRRGTLQHMVLEGKKLVASVDGGGIFVGIQARSDLAQFWNAQVPYAAAITLELAQPVRQDLFADVSARVRNKIAVTQPIPTRVRTR